MVGKNPAEKPKKLEAYEEPLSTDREYAWVDGSRGGVGVAYSTGHYFFKNYPAESSVFYECYGRSLWEEIVAVLVAVRAWHLHLRPTLTTANDSLVVFSESSEVVNLVHGSGVSRDTRMNKYLNAVRDMRATVSRWSPAEISRADGPWGVAKKGLSGVLPEQMRRRGVRTAVDMTQMLPNSIFSIVSGLTQPAVEGLSSSMKAGTTKKTKHCSPTVIGAATLDDQLSLISLQGIPTDNATLDTRHTTASSEPHVAASQCMRDCLGTVKVASKPDAFKPLELRSTGREIRLVRGTPSTSTPSEREKAASQKSLPLTSKQLDPRAKQAEVKRWVNGVVQRTNYSSSTQTGSSRDAFSMSMSSSSSEPHAHLELSMTQSSESFPSSTYNVLYSIEPASVPVVKLYKKEGQHKKA